MNNSSQSEYHDEQSMSMEVSASELMEFLHIADAIDIVLYYWWVIVLGMIMGGGYFFTSALKPQEFLVEMTLRIRIITSGQQESKEYIAIEREAQDAVAPKIIKSAIESLSHYTLVIPKDDLSQKVEYFSFRNEGEGTSSFEKKDKYWLPISVFEVEEEKGSFELHLNGDDFSLYDSENNELLKGKVGELIESKGIKIQVDDHNNYSLQRYTLKYRSKEYLAEWFSRKIKTDIVGGTIAVSAKGYDKAFVSAVLDEMATIHIQATGKRLRAKLYDTIEEKKKLKSDIDERLLQQEQELRKLRKKNMESGNTASSAKEMKAHSRKVIKKVNVLRKQRDKLQERYDDIRTVFSASHPIVVNAREDLTRLQDKMSALEASVSGSPMILLDIAKLEVKIKESKKSAQSVDEELVKIESRYKLAENHLSVAHKAKVINQDYASGVKKTIIIGILLGFFLSFAAVVVYDVWMDKDEEEEELDSEYSELKLESESYIPPPKEPSQQDPNSFDLEYPFPSLTGLQMVPERNPSNLRIQHQYVGDYGFIRADELESESRYEPSEELSMDESFYQVNSNELELYSVQDYSMEIPSTDNSQLNLIPMDQREQISLLSKSVLSPEDLNAWIRKVVKKKKPRVIGVVNLSEMDITSMLCTLLKKNHNKKPTILIDSNEEGTSIGNKFNMQTLNGFWDVMRGDVSLKKVLKRSSLGFIIPAGNPSTGVEDIFRLRKMSDALLNKFGCILLSYPPSRWRELCSVLSQEQDIFVLQEDFSLYHVVKTLEEEAMPEDGMSSEEVVRWSPELLSHIDTEKEFGKHLYQIFREEEPKQVIGFVNQSNLTLRSIFSAMRGYSQSKTPCLFVDAEKEQSALTDTLKLGGVAGFWEVMQKKIQLKKSLLQTSLGFYAIPQGEYKKEGLYIMSRFSKILQVLQKKFDWTIIQYPSEEEEWRELLKESKVKQLLFFISEENNLYVVEVDPNQSIDNLRFT